MASTSRKTPGADRKSTDSLSIRIRHADGRPVDDVDVGPLVSYLTKQPWELASDDPNWSHENEIGSLETVAKRTQETEIELFLIILGSAFSTAVVNALGTRVGDWIADQAAPSGSDESLAQFGLENEDGVEVEMHRRNVPPDDIPAILREAKEEGYSVVIRVP